MAALLWAVLSLGLGAATVFSNQLEFLVPAVAAVVVLAVSLVPGWGEFYLLQAGLFVLLSALGLVLFRRRLAALRQPKTGPVVEPVAGKTAVVVEALDEGQPGRVSFQGTTWAAESAYAVPVGAEVEVLSQKGLLLHVIPKKEGH